MAAREEREQGPGEPHREPKDLVEHEGCHLKRLKLPIHLYIISYIHIYM